MTQQEKEQLFKLYGNQSMKLVRKALVKILGFKGYLRLISGVYIKMIRKGMKKDEYPEIHHLKKVLKPGMYVIDIGANLAYYSSIMSDMVGENGKVIAIEPIPLFAEVFKKNTKNRNNIQLFVVALGTENKKVSMGIPVVNGLIRHGLSQVMDDNIQSRHTKQLEYEVSMVNGDELIQKENLEKIDYIKCDVEGYEQFVIPSLDKTIDKYQPILQIELNGKENRENVVNYLKNKGYQVSVLKDENWVSIDESKLLSYKQDFYFIPGKKSV